ncbi:hypothetical protein [Pseudoduganella albidiflava]|uniref:DUF4279 domain-containing protein n=1 Tax=Pseudoduganella albidiflava TaxID=321983 RepID=A0ABX5RW59_9BURK|nr:hypothetical protein [Pseudoduganella albidiflava]QBI02292.1 hypothetical protein EYF70_16680 [Pseudoduganella albidiflava]
MRIKKEKMAPYQYVISLRIWHPHMAHEELTKHAGRSPKYSWSAGTPRYSRKGVPLGGNHKTSYWSTELTPVTMLSEPIEVEEALEFQTEHFSKKAQFFSRVRAEGGKAEFFVGLFSDENIVVDIQPSLMGRLSHLSLGLCLDYYPWKRDESPEST